MEHNQTTKEKKPGLWSRFKSIDWQKPANIWKAVIIGIALLAVVGGGAGGAIVFTSSTAFCGFCHEMAPERATHEASVHANVTCATCHIAPDGPVKYMIHKVKSLKEVYYHVTGKPNPIHQTEHEAVPDRTCTQSGCHNLKNLDNEVVSATGIKINHKDHVDKGVQCIFCHSGVAHGKVAERNLLLTDELEYWDKDDVALAKEIVTDKHRKPNMGTCIECHARVNAGQKPYEDVNYALPYMEVDHDDHTKPTELEVPKEFASVKTDVVQNIIKQGLGLEKDGSKVSMTCTTCHAAKSMPASHVSKTWGENHGKNLEGDATKCVSCHEDQNWLRRFPKESMESYVNGNSKKTTEKVTTSDALKNNTFCANCHESAVPASHNEGWAFNHKVNDTPESQESCIICHTQDAPKATSTLSKGALKCTYCHKSYPVVPTKK